MSSATARKKKSEAAPAGAVDTTFGADEVEVLELFPDHIPAKAGTTEEIVHLTTDKIQPDPDNRPYEPDPELEASIKKVGVLSPITVVPNPDPDQVKAGKPYRARDGHRRLHASIAIGNRTIRAIIATADANDPRGHKLLKQWQANWHRKLDPMFEARLIKEIHDATGLSIAQLAKLSGKPKSTIADRLAMADAPAPFAALFERGLFTAAAAPEVRKFAQVPTPLIEQAIPELLESWAWGRYVDDKKAVPVNAIEKDLLQELGGIEEVLEELALLFHGETFEIGKKKYTADLKGLDAAREQFRKEQEQLAKKTDVKKGEKPTKEKEERWQRENRLQQERWNREAAAKRAEAARFNKASPKVFAAIAGALKKAPTGISANGRSAVADLVLHACEGQGATKEVLKLLPVGANAESILRHAAFLQLLNFATASYSRHRVFAAAKKLGVDVKKIIDEAAPAKAKKGKGKK